MTRQNLSNHHSRLSVRWQRVVLLHASLCWNVLIAVAGKGPFHTQLPIHCQAVCWESGIFGLNPRHKAGSSKSHKGLQKVQCVTFGSTFGKRDHKNRMPVSNLPFKEPTVVAGGTKWLYPNPHHPPEVFSILLENVFDHHHELLHRVCVPRRFPSSLCCCYSAANNVLSCNPPPPQHIPIPHSPPTCRHFCLQFLWEGLYTGHSLLLSSTACWNHSVPK